MCSCATGALSLGYDEGHLLTVQQPVLSQSAKIYLIKQAVLGHSAAIYFIKSSCILQVLKAYCQKKGIETTAVK